MNKEIKLNERKIAEDIILAIRNFECKELPCRQCPFCKTEKGYILGCLMAKLKGIIMQVEW